MIERLWAAPPAAPQRYAIAIGCVVGMTPFVAGLHQLISGNITILYVPAVIVAAILTGAGPALAASVAAFLAYDVLFVPPEFTLTVAEPQEWVNLVVFLLTVAVTSQIAGVARTRALEARRHEREAMTQFRLISALSDADVADGPRSALGILAEVTGCTAVSVIIDGQVRAGAGAPDLLARMAAPGVVGSAVIVARPGADAAGRWLHVRRDARAASRAPDMAGFGRVRIPRSDDGQDAEGWLVFAPLGAALRDPQVQRVLLTAGALVANAVRRERLTREANEATVLREAERLRTAMLDAVSHDLRTPLSSMIASAESLLQPDVSWSVPEQQEFLREITVEGRWLDRMVRHLLDFSRIEAGALRLAPAWIEPHALVAEVVRRLSPLVGDHPLVVDVPAGMDAVLIDEIATSEVIANLIENAVKHTPAGTPITVRARREAGCFELAVEDEGPGIPATALPHLFEPFAASAASRRRSGTGLGLVIARALAEAQDGTIRVESRAGRGARFVVTIPQRPSSAGGGPAGGGND